MSDELKVFAPDERQQLIKDCHALVTSISRKQYSVKLLRSAKNALEIVHGYKANR